MWNKKIGFCKELLAVIIFYENPEVQKILSIPVHGNQYLKVGTLKALMKIAQLSEEDLL
ncbi:type II toxin-antitoxin system HicA family toxin [Nostoc sp.]|uniref:type II toxin-antitoxin system HicA family toxin n=1 Tax=Nostoc sp. TaxID=1180 RepID=UPI002FF9CAD6